MSDGSTRKVAAAACSHENHTVEMGSCFERSCPEWKPGPWKSVSDVDHSSRFGGRVFV